MATACGIFESQSHPSGRYVDAIEGGHIRERREVFAVRESRACGGGGGAPGRELAPMIGNEVELLGSHLQHAESSFSNQITRRGVSLGG